MLTFIVIILALIFLIPTYGLSLVGLATYLILKFSNKFLKIEKAIVFLAKENPTDFPDYSIGTIQYGEVLGYAEGQNRIQKTQGQLVRFKTNIKGVEYDVVVNKEPLGPRAILGAKESIKKFNL